MKQDYKEGYVDGYMKKTAAVPGLSYLGGLLSGATKSGFEAAANIGLPAAIVAPALVGAGAGVLHSRATSPSELDQETMQQLIEAGELEEFEEHLEKQKKKRELAKKLKEMKLRGKQERSVRL